MILHKYGFIGAVLALCPVCAGASSSLDDALRATYTACIGIDEELNDLRKMAGINTAVTAVGTAVGTGATVVGLVKASKDKEIAELEALIKELRELEQGIPASGVADRNTFLEQFNSSYSTAIAKLDAYESEHDKLIKQSKKLGNWRTGLVAGATTTNIAGAIIAGTGQSTGDLQAMIETCKLAVATLRQTIGQARISGLDVSEAESIVAACSEYDYVDVSKITNRAKGAMISSVVGSTTGAAGTITSALANKDTGPDSNKQKEKNLNTAANVLSGATAAASATATVFNATQISAIKKVSAAAEKCTGVLK